jgi:dolichol-phosphate mannosyltransferase
MLVFIPTYNERDNVERTCNQLLALQHHFATAPAVTFDMLFVDDNSPDGTGAVLDQLAAQHPNVRVIHRSGKQGIGSAHQVGIAYAYTHGYDALVTMDCDGTHPPEYLPQLMAKAQQADVVVGSRYLNKDSLNEWTPFRRLLTYGGHALTTTLLGMPYDASSAYRLYRLSALPQNLFALVQSPGYAFFFESLYVLNLNQFRIAEVGILLPARASGQSKMTVGEAWRGLARLARMCLSVAVRRRQYLVPPP